MRIGVIGIIGLRYNTYNSYNTYSTYNSYIPPAALQKKPQPRGAAVGNYLKTILPDDNALLGGHKHLTIGDAEGLVECVDIAQCGIHAVLAQ